MRNNSNNNNNKKTQGLFAYSVQGKGRFQLVKASEERLNSALINSRFYKKFMQPNEVEILSPAAVVSLLKMEEQVDSKTFKIIKSTAIYCVCIVFVLATVFKKKLTIVFSKLQIQASWIQSRRMNYAPDILILCCVGYLMLMTEASR